MKKFTAHLLFEFFEDGTKTVQKWKENIQAETELEAYKFARDFLYNKVKNKSAIWSYEGEINFDQPNAL